MKIKKSELQKIIREEAMRFKKKLQLEQELSSIQSQLDEVHAGGEMDSEKNDGVHAGQNKSEFKTKNKGGFDALVEDDMEEMDNMEEMDDMEEMTYESESMEEEDVDVSGDIDISEIFAEMELEDEVSEEYDEDVNEMNYTEEGVNEMDCAEEDMNEMDYAEEGMNENGKISGKLINEEQARMQQLAGIKNSLNS